MPVVNRALRSLMISEPSRPGLLRYAGALLTDPTGLACSAIGPGGQAAPTGLTVGIPLVESRDAAGVEAISWVPVRRGDSRGPGCGLSVERTIQPDVPRKRGRHADRSTPIRLRIAGLAAVRDQLPVSGGDAQRLSMPSVPNDVDPMPPNIGEPHRGR